MIEVLNYTEFMAQKPSLYCERRGIKFYEDPVYGDDGPCFAVIGSVVFNSGFYDPWLCTSDIEMVWEMFEEWWELKGIGFATITDPHLW